MAKPRSVLIYSHDWSYAFTKTTEFLGQACERLGIQTLVRDSCDARATRLVTETINHDEITHRTEKDISKRLHTLVNDFGIDCVIALDLGWLFIPDLFIENQNIKKIYSIWFDDFISWCGAPNNAIFPYRKNSFQDATKHDKVLHCFYGKAIAREAQRLGYENQIHSNLAAPREFLDENITCTVKDRLAFIGNPGSRQEPSKQILKHLQEGATLAELRHLSAGEVLTALDRNIWGWVKEHPQLKSLIGTATLMKKEMPYTSALEILEICGKEQYPDALHFLNEKSYILEASHLVKFVLRYDRPAFVYNLYSKGLCDVVSNENEWALYGVKALPSVLADKLPEWYMKYPAHLNAANSIRDATANEKLFEISACARASINLNSPDVAACYNENEIYLVNSFEEAEEVARAIIKDPDTALTRGKRCRLRTAKEHTWDHRLENLFRFFPEPSPKL